MKSCHSAAEWTKHAHPVGWIIKSNSNEIARFVKQFCPESEIDKVIEAHNTALNPMMEALGKLSDPAYFKEPHVNQFAKSSLDLKEKQ